MYMLHTVLVQISTYFLVSLLYTTLVQDCVGCTYIMIMYYYYYKHKIYRGLDTKGVKRKRLNKI